MSTLVAQTISNGKVSTSSANVIQGSAKAWVIYNGVTQTLINSYNVSSVTYNGTGDYTITFTNAMPNTNYCATYGTADWRNLGPIDTSTTYVNTAFIRLNSRLPSTAAQSNSDFVGVAIFSA